MGENGRDFRLYLAKPEKLWYTYDNLNRVTKYVYGRGLIGAIVGGIIGAATSVAEQIEEDGVIEIIIDPFLPSNNFKDYAQERITKNAVYVLNTYVFDRDTIEDSRK